MPGPMDKASEIEARKRKVRKGTHSCWECRRRKIRCLFGPNDDKVCVPCQARGSSCRSQEFIDDAKPSQQPDRRLAQRLGRLEELMEKLVDRFMPETGAAEPKASQARGSGSTNRSPPHSPAFSTSSAWADSDDASGSGSGSASGPAMLADTPMADDNPVGLLLGMRSRSSEKQDAALLTPSSSSASSLRALSPLSARFQRISKSLHALFPPQGEIDELVATSSGASFATHMFYAQWEVMAGKCESEQDLTTVPPATSHPALLGKRLIQIAICMQKLGIEFHKHPAKVEQMIRMITEVTDQVTSNDDLVGNAEGLESLISLGMWHANAGNLRKSWLCFRRALSVGQLMGLEHGGVQKLPLCEPAFPARTERNTPSPYSLWFRINFCDRYLCLLLNLPVGTYENSFMSPEATRHDTDNERLEKLHTVAAARIVTRNTNRSSLAYTTTQSIDCELEDAARTMSREWWTDPIVAFCDTPPNLAGNLTRMMLQINHYTLLVMLHLPYMLRDSAETRYDYSKLTAMRSSREVLKRFVHFRALNDSSFSCRHVDYAGLVSAMTLLLSYLSCARKARSGEAMAAAVTEPQRLADKKLIEAMKQRLEHVAAVNKDNLTAEAAGIISQLLPLTELADPGSGSAGAGTDATIVSHGDGSENGSSSIGSGGGDGTGTGTVHLHIPYLGTISINPNAAALKSGTRGVTPSGASAIAAAAFGASSELSDLGVLGMAGGSMTDALAAPYPHTREDPTLPGGMLPVDDMAFHLPDCVELSPTTAGMGVAPGVFMQLDPQGALEGGADGSPEFPGLTAESADWTFQGVDTMYWSLISSGMRFSD